MFEVKVSMILRISFQSTFGKCFSLRAHSPYLYLAFIVVLPALDLSTHQLNYIYLDGSSVLFFWTAIRRRQQTINGFLRDDS